LDHSPLIYRLLREAVERVFRAAARRRSCRRPAAVGVDTPPIDNIETIGGVYVAMADLLPSTPDTSAAEEASPRVIGVDSEEADDLLSALSSDTARRLLTALHEEPSNPAALADRADTSLQNVQYHLERLQAAGLVEVIDTVYSEKGREMKVFAPVDRPLVVFAGREEESEGLRTALERLLGGVALLAVLSAIVQTILRGFPSLPFGKTGGGGDAGTMTAQSVEASDAAATAAGLPPGLVFFFGGLAVLLVGFAAWYVRERRR
jgi:DNA-binding transcriptional ArsR family regulator